MFEQFQQSSPEFISGLVAGSLATAFGFTLTIIWDVYKYYRDSNIKDKAVSLALRHEIEANIDILRSNKILIKQELDIIKSGSVVVDPLTPLHNSMWSVVAQNIPKKLIKNSKTLESLRDATNGIMLISEAISSRENYRINNSSMTNFNNRLEIYDGIILKNINTLLGHLEQLVQEF